VPNLWHLLCWQTAQRSDVPGKKNATVPKNRFYSRLHSTQCCGCNTKKSSNAATSIIGHLVPIGSHTQDPDSSDRTTCILLVSVMPTRLCPSTFNTHVSPEIHLREALRSSTSSHYQESPPPPPKVAVGVLAAWVATLRSASHEAPQHALHGLLELIAWQLRLDVDLLYHTPRPCHEVEAVLHHLQQPSTEQGCCVRPPNRDAMS
jgi:hypothetical protein